MQVSDRLTSEKEFHDRQARQRAARFAHHQSDLRFEDATYLDHESWIRPAFRRLGHLRGARILDYGCGHGMAAVVLARQGARVTGFDLSGGYLREARRRAEANGVGIHFVQADGEHLPFADETFDGIWGNAILHHLDLEVAGRELRRVLRPGGVAVFCEPWGDNPLLNWARSSLPYPGKERTPDEQPLRMWQTQQLRQAFPNLDVRGYQLLSMVRRVFKSRGGIVAGLERCDSLMLSAVPALGRFCRYAVITMKRED